MRFQIGNSWLGNTEPTYFIADIAANHDGSLDRAKRLIELAKDSGADAAKFQNFQAKKIVSKQGFENLKGKFAHQAKWKKSVFEVYEDAEIDKGWTAELKAHCDHVGIEYLTTPYDVDSVELVDPYVNAFKIGSGDIDFVDILTRIAQTRKPCLLATGASNFEDVLLAVKILKDSNSNIQLCLMQCNTNYTGSIDNFRHLHLRVLTTYAKMFPGTLLGLSDHTPGHSAVLGAVALGARVVEKHFTDDNERGGPDHKFSMTPKTWSEMVRATRELEMALGGTVKTIEPNEQASSIVQRRAMYFSAPLKKDEVITAAHLEALRPAPVGSVKPVQAPFVIGLKAARNYEVGDVLQWADWK